MRPTRISGHEPPATWRDNGGDRLAPTLFSALRRVKGKFGLMTMLVLAGVAIQWIFAAYYLFDSVGLESSSLVGLPLDDAWIHLVYARSIAERLAFEYNRGVLESGMTSPLWVLVLGAILKVGGLAQPAISAKMASLVCATIATIACASLAYRLGGRLAAFFAITSLVFLPEWTYAGLSGMEVSATGAMLAILAFAVSSQRRRLTILTASLLPLMRPEALVPVTLVMFVDGANPSRKPLAAAYRTLTGLAPLAVVLLGWSAYNLIATGRPLPNTFYVKSTGIDLLPLGSLARLASAWLEPVLGLSGWGFVFLTAVGLLVCFRIGRSASLAALVGPAYLAAVSVAWRVGDGPMDFWGRRYFDPVLPALAAIAGCGFAVLVGMLKRQTETRMAAGLATAVILIAIWIQVARFEELRVEYAGATANIEEVDVAIGKWLSVKLASGLKVAVWDAGAIKWYLPDHEVIDVVGLNTAGVVKTPLAEVLQRYRPDVLVSWTNPSTESLAPIDRALLRIRPDHNVVLGGDEATVWSLRYDRAPHPPDTPASSISALLPIDSLHIGDPSDESAHDFRASTSGTLRNDSSRIGEDAYVADSGRVFPVGVDLQFSLKSCGGEPVVLALRYDARSAGRIAIAVAGKPTVETDLESAYTILAEQTLRLPPDWRLAAGEKISVRAVSSPSGYVAFYRIWSFGSSECSSAR